MNTLLLYTICGLLLVLTIYKQRKCWCFIWQLNGWRGLLQQPILWLFLIIYLEPKSIMSSIQRCHKYFQFPLAIIVFNRILLYVDDPETMETILTTPECLNKTFLQNGFYANNGLLHAKDEEWKIRRKQLNPAFSHSTLIGFLPLFNRVANELKLKISAGLERSTVVKFKTLEDLVTRAVLDVSCATIMGYETNLLKHDENSIAQTYRFLMELTALRILMPWYQVDFIFHLLDNENYEKSKRANKLVKEFVANIVQQKFIEWQQKHKLQQHLDIQSTRTTSVTATASNEANDEILLNKQEGNCDVTGNTTAGGNDALKNIAKELLSLPDRNVNAVRPKQKQQQRIFIDQMFYLAQIGKLTLHDIMNESESMVVVSFETVSSCVINALLCLAIKHEYQTKLRHEIKKVLMLAKQETKNKMNARMNKTSMEHNHDYSRKSTSNLNETCANMIADDLKAKANAGYNNDENNIYVDNDNDNENVNDNDNNDNDDNVSDVEVTMDNLVHMPYLDMIINESLRLLTTVPMNLRNVGADFQLTVAQRDKCTCNMKTTANNNNNNNNSNTNKNDKNTYSCRICQRCVDVPKDTIIALDTFNMQRNERYWGKNALQFYPEHFSKKFLQQQEEKEEQTNETPIVSTTATPTATATATAATRRHSYAFIPFSKGLRTCIGYRYSIYLIKIVLIKLISSFEFSTNIQLNDLQHYEGVSLKFRNAEDINFQIHAAG